MKNLQTLSSKELRSIIGGHHDDGNGGCIPNPWPKTTTKNLIFQN
ncbi:bacteriocin [Aquimarina longa]|nr:bacteriocin [Aquimarina longa]